MLIESLSVSQSVSQYAAVDCLSHFDPRVVVDQRPQAQRPSPAHTRASVTTISIGRVVCSRACLRPWRHITRSSLIDVFSISYLSALFTPTRAQCSLIIECFKVLFVNFYRPSALQLHYAERDVNSVLFDSLFCR